MADNNQQQPAAAAEAAKLRLTVSNKTFFVWVFFNGLVFGSGSIFLLTDAATADRQRVLLYGELGCSVVAVLAAPLHTLLLLQLQLTSTRTATTRNRWATAAAVEVLAWVALAATAAIHCMEVACDRIFFAAAHPEHKHNFAYVVFISVCLSVDLVLAGVLLSVLCCSPRRRIECDQGDDDVEI